MIISPGRRYIFVHVPKTGGTSLALALEARAMADDILIGDTPKARRRRHRLRGAVSNGRIWKHSTLADIDPWISAAQIAESRIFTIVRNPYERVLSYYHWARAQSFDHPVVRLARKVDFATFLHDRQVGDSFRNAPFASYVTDARGVERCDLYLRLERIDTDLSKLENLLDLRLAPLPVANRSDRPADHRAAYGPAERRRLEEICKHDLENFDYDF